MDRTKLLSLEPRHPALDWTGLETVYGPRPPSSVLQLGSFIIMCGGMPPRNLPSLGGMPHHDHADHLHQSIQSINQSINQFNPSINQISQSINQFKSIQSINQFKSIQSITWADPHTRTHACEHRHGLAGWLFIIIIPRPTVRQ
jgi:hypothetical protein